MCWKRQSVFLNVYNLFFYHCSLHWRAIYPSMDLTVNNQTYTASGAIGDTAHWSNASTTGLKCSPFTWTGCWDSTEVSLQCCVLLKVRFYHTDTSVAPRDLWCGGIQIFSTSPIKTMTRTQYHLAGSSTRNCYRSTAGLMQMWRQRLVWEFSTQSGGDWLSLTSYCR